MTETTYWLSDGTTATAAHDEQTAKDAVLRGRAFWAEVQGRLCMVNAAHVVSWRTEVSDEA